MRLLLLLLTAGGAAAAVAQDRPAAGHAIQVTGFGRIATMPDRAVIDFSISGEGRTPDEAARALQSKQQAVEQGLRGLLHGPFRLTSSNLAMTAVRGAECQNGNSYNPQPRLDQGTCAIIGYVASLQATVRVAQIDQAGTAVGLAGRLGARDARLQSFELSDAPAAYRAALNAAVADAKRQAGAIAAAAGGRLGPVLTLRDQNYRPAEDSEMVTVTGSVPPAPPPPPPPAPPIPIDVHPAPIETTAQVYAAFGLEP